MSNVLIGFIGVILFIGLALAAAPFLGPRFQQSTDQTKASSIVATLKQVNDAGSMFLTMEGRLPVDIDELEKKGYLKSFSPRLFSGMSEVSLSPGRNLMYADVMMTARHKGVCQAVNRQTSGSDQIGEYTDPSTNGIVTGCYRNEDGNYVVLQS